LQGPSDDVSGDYKLVVENSSLIHFPLLTVSLVSE
jgi:hypothetical protein